ncbi:MAG: ATP:cob(I)alamin adenosyltransferase [Euryarchaeota archaeon]|nr:ATP:cob(I)alamin adenosyltransferase [Euryarchaeota archaeon]
MVRITKVHTGGGDLGETSLVDGSRVAKSDARIEIVGTCDEVNALLGNVLMEANRLSDTHADGGQRVTVRRVKDVCSTAIGRLQSELFDLGAELACPPDQLPEFMQLIDQQDSDRLCNEMDAWNEELEPLESFILPTGSAPIAAMHLARTVTRRLERSMVGIKDEMRPLTLQYVNRLSDWIFILTRWVSFRLGEDETYWTPKGKRESGTADMTRRQNANM